MVGAQQPFLPTTCFSGTQGCMQHPLHNRSHICLLAKSRELIQGQHDLYRTSTVNQTIPSHKKSGRNVVATQDRLFFISISSMILVSQMKGFATKDFLLHPKSKKMVAVKEPRTQPHPEIAAGPWNLPEAHPPLAEKSLPWTRPGDPERQRSVESIALVAGIYF